MFELQVPADGLDARAARINTIQRWFVECTRLGIDLRGPDAGLRWVVEPGTFRVAVGASSRDLRLRGVLTVC